MKKSKTRVFFITLTITTLLCGILITSIIQRKAIRTSEPLTVDELDRLAAEWRVASQDKFSPSNARTGSSTSNTDKRPSLTETLSKEARKTMSDDLRGRANRLADQLSFEFTASLATTLDLAGIDDGAGFYYYDTAGVAYLMGDWQTAKQYFRKALNYPLSEYGRQRSLIRLAQLEDDPLVADKLLDLACPTGRYSWVLYEATDLALRTGSENLFHYYLARLRAQQPGTAAQFDSVSDRPGIYFRQED